MKGGGCSSHIGRIGGAQTLTLATACFVAIGKPIHELMHATGFYHEQRRTDHDDYITVNWDNIELDKKYNFLSYDQDVIQYPGASYDYGSVLHYGQYGFGIDPNISTIIPPPKKSVEIGERKGFSKVDLYKLNKLYKCDEKN